MPFVCFFSTVNGLVRYKSDYSIVFRWDRDYAIVCRIIQLCNTMLEKSGKDNAIHIGRTDVPWCEFREYGTYCCGACRSEGWRETRRVKSIERSELVS